MAKSIHIGLVAEVAVLAVLFGCGADQRQAVQRCVDKSWTVVPDEHCDEEARAAGAGSAAPVTGAHPSYFWYYGGQGYYPGQVASGGTLAPAPGVTPIGTSSPGVTSASTRGGFGASGGTHVSGGGGGS